MRSLLIALALTATSTCFLQPVAAAPAEKPKTGSKHWTSNIWAPFNSWTTPSRKATRPKEPGLVTATKKTFGAAWQGTKKTTKNAWDKTMYLLRPYDRDPQPRRSPTVARREADAGFWSNLFTRQAKQEPMTVNEFLKQPTVY